MKFAPTSLFKSIALGSGKYIQLKAYARITTVLSDPLDSGVPWIDVSEYLASNIGDSKVPEMSTSVEWNLGKPAFDTLELTGTDIPFWRDKIFYDKNPNYNSTWIEFKIEMRLGLSETRLADDVVYGFSGYVDQKPRWNEKEGTVSFTVISYDEVGARKSAETITTQVLNIDLDGNGLVGLKLENLLGVYVIDANVVNYQLKKGLHTIELKYSSGNWDAKLDDGEEVELPTSNDSVVLTNKDNTQRLSVYVKVSELQELSEAVSQTIIKKTDTETLPSVWYRHCWIARLLKLLYSQIGLNDCVIDDFKIPTYDDRLTPSFLDIPPAEIYYDKPTAIAHDGTSNKLWIGIRDRIYSCDLTTYDYNLIGSVPSGYKVLKLWGEDSANGYIWGIAKHASSVCKIIRITIATSTLTTYDTTSDPLTADSNFDIDLSVRRIYYLSNVSSVKKINAFLLDTLTEVNITQATDLDCTLPAFCDGDGNYYFQTTNGSNHGLQKASYDGSDWTIVDKGYNVLILPMLSGAYSKSLGLWIGYQYDSNYANKQYAVIYNPADNTKRTYMYPSQSVGFISDEGNEEFYFFLKTPQEHIAKEWQSVASDDTGDNLIAGMYTGRICTSQNGSLNWIERQPNWQAVVSDSNGSGEKVWSIASDADGSNLIACASYGRLYTSADSGANWTERQPVGNVDKNWRSVASDADGSNLIACVYGGRLYTSSDYGANWTERQPAGDVNKYWQSVASDLDGSNLIACVYDGRIYTSADSGVNWTERRPAGDVDKKWYSVASSHDGGNLIACVYGGRLYTSSNYGASWTERQPAGDVDKYWQSVASNFYGNNLIACVDGGRIYISSTSGSNWNETRPAGDVDKNWTSVASNSDGGNLIACALGGRLYYTNNAGTDWTECQPAGDVDKYWSCVAIDNGGGNLMVGVREGRLYTSSDLGVNWTEVHPVCKYWQSVASDSDGSNLIMCYNNIYGGRLYTSSDYGASWTERQPAGDANKNWSCVSSDADGSNLIACASYGRLYTSADSGANWTERQPAGDVDKNWQSVASDSDGGNLIACVYGGRLYTSSDSGVTWTERRPAGDVDKKWYSVASDSDGSNLIACVYGGRLYTSSDSGATWTERQPAGDANKNWTSVASDSDGSNLIACANSGRLYTSADSGASWTERQPAGNVDKNWRSVASDADGSNLIACYLNNPTIYDDVGIIYVSNNYGSDWQEAYQWNELKVYKFDTDRFQIAGDSLKSEYSIDDTISANQICYDPVGDRIIGFLSPSGIMFQYAKYASMFVDVEADFTGMSVIDAIREIEQSFGLVGVISPNKKVNIFRRFDENGNPKTSGNVVAITVDEVENIEKEENYVEACTLVVVDNGIESHSYDGTNFDPGLIGDGRIVTISGRFIPTEFLKDMAVYAYNFFSKNLSLYTFPLANCALWQYECFDELQVTFTVTKIKKVASGPLYSVTIDPSGSTTFKALL